MFKYMVVRITKISKYSFVLSQFQPLDLKVSAPMKNLQWKEQDSIQFS